MSAQDLEQRARELLAAEYERDGKAGAADHIRTQPLLPNKARAVRAIVAALRQQPAPVDLKQFRLPVQEWKDKVLLPRWYHDDQRHDEADRLLSIIDNAGKVECAEPAAWRVLKIGAGGSAFDSQDIRRAYTYEHQPGNEGAWKLGRATSVAATDSAGDYIDRGLSLLKRLQEEGFGVFHIGPIEPMTHQPAPVVDDAMVDAAIAAQDAHWANDANYPTRAPRSAKGNAELHDKLARGAMRDAIGAVLERLGLIGAHIDASVARMEADARAQGVQS